MVGFFFKKKKRLNWDSVWQGRNLVLFLLVFFYFLLVGLCVYIIELEIYPSIRVIYIYIYICLYTYILMYVCMCLSFQSNKKRKVVVLKLLIKGETTLNC